MSSLEQISTDLKQTDSVIVKLRDVFGTLKSHQSLISTLCQQWEDFESSFSAIRAVVDSCAMEFEAKEKDIESREKELESFQKQLKSSERGLEAWQKQLESSEEQLELKRKRLLSLERDAEWKEKQLELWEKELGIKQKQLEELKRSIDDRSKSAELRDCQPNNAGEVVVKSEPYDDLPLDDGGGACLRFCVTMDGKTLQSFLNGRFNEHKSMGDEVYNALKLSNEPSKLVLDAIDGFFPPHLKNGDVEFETTVVRSSCVLLLEQLLRMKPVVKDTVRKEARELAKRWRKKIKEEGESYSAVLGFLLLVVVYGLSSSYDKADLERFLGMVHQHGQASQLGEILGLLVNKGSIMSSPVKAEQPEPETRQETRTVASISTDPRSELVSLCANMDVNGLKLYLCKHNFKRKITFQALKSASDPVKLVFDLTQEFYTSDSGSLRNDVYRHGCIRLLEVLMNLSLKVNSNMKSAALEFAFTWKVRLDGTKKKEPLEVYGFLQFVAAYKLASSFSADELVALFGTFYNGAGVYEFQKNPKLCHALGLTNKIPDVVETLIKQNQYIWAVKYICIFKLVDRFPPTPLLKAYLDNINQLVEAKKKKNTDKAQLNAITKEYGALRAVIQCIKDFKLESEFPSSDLKQRCSLLEKEKAQFIIYAKTGKKRPASAVGTSSAQPQDQSLEKRPKIPPQGPSPFHNSNCVAAPPPTAHSSPYLSSSTRNFYTRISNHGVGTLSSMPHGPHPYSYSHSSDCRPVGQTTALHLYSHPSHVVPPMNTGLQTLHRPLPGGVVGSANGSHFGGAFGQGRGNSGCGDYGFVRTYSSVDYSNYGSGYYGGGAHMPYPSSYGFQHLYRPPSM